jgi:hypothetical protein
MRRRLGVDGRGEEERGKQQRGGAWFGFIETQDVVEVKGRESGHAARHRAAGGAGVLDGVAWRPLGIGCSSWNGEGRTAVAVWRWEKGWGDAWKAAQNRRAAHLAGQGRRRAAEEKQRGSGLGKMKGTRL